MSPLLRTGLVIILLGYYVVESEGFDSDRELKALSRNISSILDSFGENYDKRVRPNYGGDPVVVGVTMYVLSISSVSEVLMVSWGIWVFFFWVFFSFFGIF
jgi:glycine receptor alpha-3